MQIRMTHRYPAKVSDVIRVMTDEAAVRHKHGADTMQGEFRFGRRESGGVVEIDQERLVRFPVPDGAERLLVPEFHLHQRERWAPTDLDGCRRAVIHLSTPELPVRAEGRVVLIPEGPDATRMETAVEFTCTVPMIGGRILGAVADGARQLIEADLAANERALAAGRS